MYGALCLPRVVLGATDKMVKVPDQPLPLWSLHSTGEMSDDKQMKTQNNLTPRRVTSSGSPGVVWEEFSEEVVSEHLDLRKLHLQMRKLRFQGQIFMHTIKVQIPMNGKKNMCEPHI